MALHVVELECPGCGYPVTIETEKCPKCFRDIVITSFNSVCSMSPISLNRYANKCGKALIERPDKKGLNRAIAFCYLKLNMYDKALPYFDKAIEDNFDDADSYFYASVCLLKGKRAFRMRHSEIDKIEEYLNAAILIEPKGIYYYFWAYIKYDYFSRKYLRTTPSYKELLKVAKDMGVSQTDIGLVFEIMKVDLPKFY